MNLLENDTPEYIKESIVEAKQQISNSLDEIESCMAYIREAEAELNRREF